MKIQFKNLGYIDSGEIEPGKFTVICGKNNTGKTYINYAIYGLLNFWKRFNKLDINHKFDSNNIELSEIVTEDNLRKYYQKLSEEYSKQLPIFFGSSENSFENARIEVAIDNFSPDISEEIKEPLIINDKKVGTFIKEKDSNIANFVKENGSDIPKPILNDFIFNLIGNIIFKSIFRKPFIITSERTGIQLFYKELDINKNVIIEKIFEKKLFAKKEKFLTDIFGILDDVVARYPISIRHNVDYIRDYSEYTKNKSFIFKETDKYKNIIKTWGKILNGEFKISNKEIVFVMKKEKERNKIKIPIYLGSSAIKSLVSLDLYIKHIAQKDDMLIIDEPELNLHPDNQILMARLLSQLVNAGINVLITTHSDYIIKELNNLIMLSGYKKNKEIEKLLSDYKYNNDETLNPDDLKIYLTEDHKIKKVPISSKDGIELDLFDGIILNHNDLADKLYFSQDDIKYSKHNS